jgi:hypothetical protein
MAPVCPLKTNPLQLAPNLLNFSLENVREGLELGIPDLETEREF